jgi:hypothetical protein
MRRIVLALFVFAACTAHAHDEKAPQAQGKAAPAHTHEHDHDDDKDHDHGHTHDHDTHGNKHPHIHENAAAVILDAANWDEYAPTGKEADAIYGDAALVNRYLTAVIAAPLPTRNANMTVRNVGGQLIDLTVNEPLSDQLSCFYIQKRQFVFDSLSHSSTKSVRVEKGREINVSSAEVKTSGVDPKTGLKAELTYKLGGSDNFITIVTRFENPTDAPLTMNLADDLRFDAGKESAIKATEGSGPFYWFGDEFWGQAYAVVPGPGWSVRYESDARVHKLAYSKSGNDKGELMLAAGASFEFTRRVFPAQNTLKVQSNAIAGLGGQTKMFSVAVTDAAGNIPPDTRIHVRGGDGFSGWGRTDDNGLMTASVPIGTYFVTAEIQGHKLRTASPLKITVQPNVDNTKDNELKLYDWNPGKVVAAVTDESGKPIASKVEFIGQSGTISPNFGPDTAVFGIRNLRYTPDGKFEQTIAPGEYEVRVSHGVEYDAFTGKIEVKSGQKTPLNVKLPRSVNTPGWVSADFHSHSSPSGDNTSSQLGRVLNLVAEHLEFAPCTEHNRVETYDPEIAELKVGHAVRTVSGLELTGSPLPLNHQNAFPLKYVPRTQDGGAPTTDADPSVQIERLFNWDNMSEKLIQQNHPDIGWLFFDKDGDGKPDGGYPGPRKFMDVMEIHPIDMVTSMTPSADYRGREESNQVFGWLQLLNQGFRIPGVVNTDAHYNYHGSGGLRNWIASSTDDPAKIDVLEMVRNSEKGHLIMSNGPYLEYSVRESGNDKPVISGADLAAKSGKVTISLKVQCPNWIDVNRVFVLVNGKIVPELDFSKEDHPGKFRDGTVKFETEAELKLESDAHLIAVAVGEGLKLGPIMGPDWGEQMPTALSNPIFVDVNGNGFEPNKDTLGHPLPVKFVAKPR